MSNTLRQRQKKLDPARSKAFPGRMRVLFITTAKRPGSWLAEAFAADSESEVELEEVVGSAAGLERLRNDPFDVVLLCHEPGRLDALDLIEGYRAGITDEPIIVLGTQSEQEMAAACYEVGADGYICVNTTTTRNLAWVITRAVQRHALIRENRRLTQMERRRLQQEHDEASRLLSQQRALIEGLRAIQDEKPSLRLESDFLANAHYPPNLPSELVNHYRELLRTYVIMGAGNLGHELACLGELLTRAGVTAKETMQLHLYVLQEMIRGLGTLSSRHVMNRADLLVLEIMMYLADEYRHRHDRYVNRPRQLMLEGF